jgi:uncharacterized protein YyaL (SSP411 family)
MNRLSREKSPYLLQHANNPVDWYPWGGEAFEKAAREDRPIFLSIGYSTCHWCHVMEHESFEDPATAEILNQYFVPVKVDREERPDVDRVYMLFVQASTGSGGWPMSVWLTPERKPFFGGTYFPPDNRFGRPGFRSILQSLAQAWSEDRARVEDSGLRVVEQLKQYAAFAPSQGEANKDALDSAYFAFRRMFDPRLGGFGGAPKFPRPSVFNFLLRYYAFSKNEGALDMVLLTLREMAKGGMNDQLGGGFHRYSVDERWFVPHFEKMLYDQAQIAISLIEAFQITRDGQYASAARDIFSYVQRDLTHPDGGFYSAEDADSAESAAAPNKKREGAFYVWTQEEIGQTLGAHDAELFCLRYGVKPGGNVDEDPHGEFGGQNILYESRSIEEVAAALEIGVDQARATLRSATQKLLDLRTKRPRPHLDDKILAAWNGLMISAFAKGAQALGEDRYLEAASGAAKFLREHLWDESRGVLLRRFRDGESAIDGFLDDYAFCILAFLDLYETRFDSNDFHFAVRLADRALALFEDRENGGFYSTAEGAENLVLRLKDDYDGAEPSGNSMMAIALLRLARMTGRDDFLKAAERTLKAFSSKMTSGGPGVPQMLVALSAALGKPMEIVLAGPHDPSILAAIRRRFLPNAVVMRASESPVPMPYQEETATVYVCSNFTCNLPVTKVNQLDELLE